MMEGMRGLAPVLLFALGSCSFATPSESGRIAAAAGPRAPHAPAVGDVWPFGDPSPVEPGTWVRVRIAKDAAEQELTIAVDDRRGGRTWMEVIEEGDPRRASLRLVTAGGRIERAVYREVTSAGEESIAVAQPVVQSDGEEREVKPESVETAAGELAIGARRVKTTVETRLFRDEELGREYRESRTWSRDVPPLVGGGEHGGLVRLEAGGRRIEVLDFGTGHRPVTLPPR